MGNQSSSVRKSSSGDKADGIDCPANLAVQTWQQAAALEDLSENVTRFLFDFPPCSMSSFGKRRNIAVLYIELWPEAFAASSVSPFVPSPFSFPLYFFS